MDYQTKRNMILRAYKWREDNKKKKDEEFYAQTMMVFMFIITLSHLLYIYNNYDRRLLYIDRGNQECSKSEQDTTP